MNEAPRQWPQAGDRRLIGRVRKQRITQLVRERGFMSSAALAAMFGVSEMTVRRDLAELELRGVIQRTRFHIAPALSLVPLARLPPNGC